MKPNRSYTYKKFSRAMYLAGLVFLLAGMFLQMVNVPAQASVQDSAAFAPTRLPPGGPKPPVPSNPSLPKPPVAQPTRSSGGPAAPPAGPGSASGIDRGSSVLPTVGARRAQPLANLPGASVAFSQTDYCYAGGPGQITATAIVTLPEGVSAYINTDWYIVYPPQSDPTLNQNHYDDTRLVKNGDQVTWQGTWPGLDGYPNTDGPGGGSRPIEIHFGANLLDTNKSPISDGAGLDVFYNGQCNAKPALTITHACVVGSGEITWTVHNPGSTNMPFTWTATGTPSSSGSGTAAANSDATFTTPGGAFTVTVEWNDGLGGKSTATDTSDETCSVANADLVLGHDCTASGVQWWVSNPNNTPVNYSFDLDGTVTTGTVDANAAKVPLATAPSTDAHQASLTFNGKTITDNTAANACTLQRFTVAPVCNVDNTVSWTIHNPNGETIAFTWAVDASTGSGTIGPNETLTLPVTSTPGADHTMRVTWGGQDDTATYTAGTCTGTVTPPPPVLTIGHACITGQNQIQWTLTNGGGQNTTFEYQVDNGPWTAGAIDAGQLMNLVVTDSTTAHDVTVRWTVNDATQTDTDHSNANACGIIQPKPLMLSFACDSSRGVVWMVTNPNAEAITFTWDRNGAVKGTATVNGKKTKSFLITPVGKKTTVTITWGEGQSISKTTSVFCGPPSGAPDLSVSYACVLGTSNMQWIVSNSGTASAFFEWSVDGGKQTGAETIGTGVTKTFTVTTSGTHTVTYKYSGKTGAVTSSAQACLVSTPPPPPTATPTPGSPTVTGPGTGTPSAGTTPLPTVQAPASAASGGKAILTTGGADLTHSIPMGRVAGYLGLLFLGIGLVSDGLGRKRR